MGKGDCQVRQPWRMSDTHQTIPFRRIASHTTSVKLINVAGNAGHLCLCRWRGIAQGGLLHCFNNHLKRINFVPVYQHVVCLCVPKGIFLCRLKIILVLTVQYSTCLCIYYSTVWHGRKHLTLANRATSLYTYSLLLANI